MIGSIILKMSKQALLMLVDVGHSMDEPFSDTSSRVRIALECCKLTLQQKIFNNSSHELGLLLFGDNESDDGTSLVLQSLQKPTVDFVRKVQQLSQASFDNSLSGGDIFSTINRGLNMINEHVKKRKFNKRLFVFTNGSGASAFNRDDIMNLADKIKNVDVKLNIVPIDFMTTYDLGENKLDEELMDHIQQQNAEMLMDFKRLAEDHVQIFPASLAIELYKQFRKKDSSPVARYKGFFELTPGLEIEIATYKAVRKQKLKSLARYDASSPFDPIVRKEKQVIIEHNYVMQGDESGKLVDRQNVMNAFYYGPQLVPISPLLEAGSKVLEDKNFRLLGFVDKDKVPRHAFMGDVDIIVPSTANLVGRKLFTALNYSMLSLNKYGLARYIPRNSKNGVTPKMVVLIPYRSAEREMFYLVEMPTVEDVRQYPFNPLRQSTTQQKDMVKGLVGKMMLFGEDGEEQIKVESTFNPMRQYFYQSIFHRALNDTDDLPPLDPVISNYMNPERSKQAETKVMMQKLRKTFGLVRKVNLASKENQKTVVWKDVLEELSTNQEQQMVKEESEMVAQVPIKAGKFAFEDEDNEIQFNPAQPTSSFRKMVSYNKEDLVAKALESMKQYIEGKLPFTVTEEAYRQLVECASELRKACVQEQEHESWDSWFKHMRNDFTSFHNRMKGEGLGLIKGDNTEVFKVAQLHHVDLDQALFDELD